MSHMFAVWDFSKMFSNYDIGVILYGEWGEPSDETSPYGDYFPQLGECLLSPLSFKQINQDSNSASYLGIKKLAHRSYWYKTSYTCRFTRYNMLCHMSHVTSHFFNGSIISLREQKKTNSLGAFQYGVELDLQIRELSRHQ